MLRVLLTWIGFADLKAAAGDAGGGLGPIGQAVKERDFDHVVLLSDRHATEGASYQKWLASLTPAAVELRASPLKSPTDYELIYERVREQVAWARERYGRDARFSFHLSPGTPAMAVIWILVGTTERAELLQSSKEQGVQTAKIPFQIAAEFIPALVQQADEDLERVAAGTRPDDASFDDMLHQSREMKGVVAKARLAAKLRVPLLIQGESGTGKELLARAIHAASGRSGKFVAVNCGAIPAELVESELFGHKKGAFTGALEDRRGHFEQAKGGTLFLDELGELPLTMQVKLLRAVQEKKVVRVGESHPLEVDVRIVSATNLDLAAAVDEGAFREDLYYRLAVLVLHLPPLRERRGDILMLADRLLELQHEQLAPSSQRKKLSAAAKNLLLRQPWRGNVRELEATLLRALVWSTASTISETDVERALVTRAGRPGGGVLDLPLGNGFEIERVVTDVARHYIERALEETHGNKTKAAQLVGLKSQQTLTNWAKRHGVKA